MQRLKAAAYVVILGAALGGGCQLIAGVPSDVVVGQGSGGGQPMSCMQDKDCDDNNPCTDDTCVNQVCSHTASSNAPDDHNACTVDSCTGGVETHDAKAAMGQKCGANSTLVCDGMGNCLGCMSDADCEASTDCQKWSCNLGTKLCEFTNSPVGKMATDMTPGDCLGAFCDGNGGTKDAPLAQGTACSVNNGSVCDVAGNCVGCVVDADCKTGLNPSCDTVSHLCTACDDGVQNGTETGTDCGGPKCGKCKGDTCGLDMDCGNGLPCVDGVCCENACKAQCKTCNLQGQLGTCVNVAAGSFDAPVCNAPTYACDGAGNCKENIGHTCNANGDCYNNACRAGFCRGGVGDACTDKVDCASNRCVAGKCAACSGDADCSSSTCNQMTQQCKGAYGDPCASDAECSNGKCRNGLCRGDIYDSCTANNQCATEFCTANTCKPCMFNTDCVAVNPALPQCALDTMFMNEFICQLPKGAYCSYGLQCASQNCAGFPAKCQ